ncbi:MAG: hypothetical protein ACKKL6_02330 [Candidatus Komeilibacteria bacterium]
MNSIGNWLLNTVWPMLRDSNVDSWQATAIMAVFLVSMAASIFGIWSRITDFIFNSGTVLAIIFMGSVPVGLIMSDYTHNTIGAIALTTFQTFMFLFYAIAIIVTTSFTLYALYKGEQHMNMPEAWSTSG